MYLEMAPVMQIYNVFCNRWCGAYWASKGIRVIPSVNWGDENTFDFCLEGIEKGSTESMMYISKADCEENWESTEEWCHDADEILEYMVGVDRLRDVITQVTVIERTI